MMMSPDPSSNKPGESDQRFLRNRDLVDQEAINRHTVAIIGVGAIGSQLASNWPARGHELRAHRPRCGQRGQSRRAGFYEDELGMAKVHAVADRLQRSAAQSA